MSDDEDVVFEGSPIYKHLQDIGYTDFEAEESQAQNYAEAVEATETPKHKQSVIYSFGTTLKIICSSITRTNRAKEKLYQEVIRFVIDSKLINYSDQLLLDHFLPEGNEFLSSGNQNIARSLKWPPGIASIAAIGCIPIGLFMSNSLLVWCSSLAVWSSVFAISAPIAWWFLQDLQSFYKICARIKQLKNLVSLFQEGCQQSSKSLRLLQEVDLISRGFVLAQGSSSFINQESSESPPCTTLRLALDLTLNIMSRLLCDIHIQLAPWVKNYPCLMGLFSDQDIIGAQEHENPKQHLKHLKEVTNLVKLQISTVLTELILVIGNPDLVGKLLEKELFPENQLTQLRKAVKELSNHLEYTRAFWLHNRTEEETPRSLENKRNCVYLALHSLSLHMHAFLYKVQDLENKFQVDDIDDFPVTLMEKSDLEELPPYEDVKQQLQLIKAELDSCHGCWEEAVARVDRKYCVKPDDMGENQTENILDNKDENELQLLETKKMPIILSEIDEPVVQDEVFEAFIEEEYSSRLDNVDYDDDIWNADAKKRRQEMKQQRKQGKLVLNELQPILMQRREMWDQRETAALRRKQDPNSAMEAVPIESPKEKGQLEELDHSKEISQSTEQTIIESRTKLKDLPDTVSKNEVPDGHEIIKDEEDEVDSDEERLKVYKRVKQELDDHEETLGSEREVERFALSFPFGMPLKREFVNETATETLSVSSSASPQRGQSYETEEKVFSHGDDSIEDPESSDIDWNSTQLPARQLDTLEDRIQLLSGLHSNLHAGLAAQAQELSKQFRLGAMGPMTTFGGEGEGEIFGGSDSEKSEESDN